MSGYLGVDNANSSSEHLRSNGCDVADEHESFMMSGGIANSGMTAKATHSVHSLAPSASVPPCKYALYSPKSQLILGFMRRHRKALVLGSSVVFSIIVSLYNSFIFNKQHYNLGLPIFAAVIYDTTQYALAAIILLIRERRVGPSALLAVYRQCSVRQYAKFMVPCGLAAALNVALSNCSLQLISLSFYTMVKSSSLMFLLLFAFLFRLEYPTRQLFGVIAMVGAGLMLMLYHPVSFSMSGFVLVFSSAILSGLRWALTQVILQRCEEEESHHENWTEYDASTKVISGIGPLRTILFLGPVIIGCLLSLSLLVEGPQNIANSTFFASMASARQALGLCVLGGLQHFLVITLEYQCVRETSVLTLSVIGIVKEVAIIGVSMLILGDRIPLINVVGAIVVIAGIFLYSVYKMKRPRQREDEISYSEGDSSKRRHRRHSHSHHLEEAAWQSLYISESPWILDPLYSTSSDTLASSQLLLAPPVAAMVRDSSVAEDLFHVQPIASAPAIVESKDGSSSAHATSPILRDSQIN